MSLFGWNIHIYTFILVYLAIGLFWGRIATNINYNPSGHHDSELHDSWALGGLVTVAWPLAFVAGVAVGIWYKVLRPLWMPPAARQVEQHRKAEKLKKRRERERDAKRQVLQEQMESRAADYALREKELQLRQQEMVLEQQFRQLQLTAGGDPETLSAFERDLAGDTKPKGRFSRRQPKTEQI